MSPVLENTPLKTGTFSASQKRVCSQCGFGALKGNRRSLFDRLLSLQHFVCGRCNQQTRHFRFDAGTVILFICVLAVPAALFAWRGNYAAGWFGAKDASAQSDVESILHARNAVSGQLSSYEQMMMKRPQITMNNASILKLRRGKASTQVIIQLIRKSNADYDLSPDAVLALLDAEVDQTVMLAMIEATSR